MKDMIEYWMAYPVQFLYLQVMQLLFPCVQLMASWNNDLTGQKYVEKKLQTAAFHAQINSVQ